MAACVVATAAPAMAAPCRIEAKTAFVEKVTITPKDAPEFELKLDKVPLTAVPSSGQTATLQVKAPLRFTATAYPMDKLAVRLAKRTTLLGGRVVLAAGLAPASLGFKGGVLQSKPPLNGFSLRHRTLDIPCTALTIASSSARPPYPNVVVPKGRTEHATPSDYIPLYRTPREVGPVWMKFSAPLKVIARKDRWIKLKLTWSDGSSVQGWVPNKLVEVRLDEPLYGVGGPGTTGIGGMCGRSHRPPLVTFTVRRNAPIHHDAGGVVWAHAAKDIKVKALRLSRSDGWVQIASLDGLPPKPCSEHQNVWVHAKYLVWSKTIAQP